MNFGGMAQPKMNFGFSKPGDDPFAELLGESTGSSFPSNGTGFNLGNS